MEAKRIALVAPLNWGLGHATRCIPLISEYLEKGWQIHMASDGDALELLRREFPKLIFHDLPAYDVRYSRSSESMMMTMVSQIPKIKARISKEKKWLDRFLMNQHLDLIISDNRYGLHHDSVKSVIICHQLNIKTPIMSGVVSGLHARYLNRFDECWIPDSEDRRLSGDLSAGELKIPVRFIGPLSRLHRAECHCDPVPFLAILSGPEPQRSLLEKALIPVLRTIPNTILIRGIIKDESQSFDGELKIIGNLGSRKLEGLINCSEVVICRSGYSSIMDLCAMKKEGVLIPTPGQPEQQYLAEHLKNHPLFTIIEQSEIPQKLEAMIHSRIKLLS
ncbi:MAG: glycosyltransferase [Flavobacteriales bacterium]|nr:glycosyltransferase [Flavobacteriales bacterium]